MVVQYTHNVSDEVSSPVGANRRKNIDGPFCEIKETHVMALRKVCIGRFTCRRCRLSRGEEDVVSYLSFRDL